MREFIRYIVYWILQLERRYLGKIRNNVFLKAVSHRYLISLKPHPMARGIAIGMFWCFIPMPFQMIPATFFCWLGFANLPIAILCVWISNPFTYLPIFFIEYRLGVLLQSESNPSSILSFDDFSKQAGLADIFNSFGEIYFLILQGGIFVGIVAAGSCYFLAFPLNRMIIRYRKKRHANTR